jgi:asparagine synthase (glutamine-hydrolysing)
MCGICGIYNFDNTKVSEKDIHLMNEEMHLRGPDDSGIYTRNNIGLGMKRLSIIDLDNGHQPMVSDDGEIIIVFNGEIYNFIELRKDLINKGYLFLTNSDTEVVIQMYKEYGETFVQKLNGMFAICLFDKKKNIFLILRDRVGIKPLFYYLNEKKIVFASSISSIKKICNDVKIDNKNFLLYLSLNYVPNSNSIYNQINKLKPGHYARIKNNKIEFINYWSLPIKNNKVNEEEFNSSLKDLIIDSVKIQSRSDVEVGSMLSGGIDSSIVTSLFSKNIKKEIKTFCIDFTGKEPNENEDALEVSRKIQSKHYYKEINSKFFFSSLKKIGKLLDEPIADNAIIPSFLISEMAKKNDIKVILSGAGADELFGGYARHYQSFNNFFCGILKLDKNFSKKISKILPLKLRNYFFKLNSNSLGYVCDTSGVNIASLFRILENDNKLEELIIHEIESIFEPFLNHQDIDYKERLMKTDMFNYLPNDVLSLLDKSTMMNSIEGRVPFLDHRIIEYVYSNDSKIFEEKKILQSKSVLKNIFKKEIPSGILKKKKIGFNAPLTVWQKENYQYFKKNFSNNDFYSQFFKSNLKDDSILSKKENIGLLFALNLFDEWFEYKNG